MMHKRSYTIVGILIIWGSLFAMLGVVAQPEAVTQASETAFPALCDIPSEAGRLFRQTWSKATPLPDTRYVWQVSGGEWEITAQELHQVGTQVGRNVAYETVRDIGDGVIVGCMQFTSAISEVVPGGIVFRYQDAKNGYGVGFAKHNGQIVFAIGKSVRGTPRMLAAVTGYDPAEVHHVKIVLRGPRIQVYLDGDSTPIFDLNDTSFASGKIGYITYSSTARFGSLWADLDCSGFADDLSSIGQAVYSELAPTAFCSNQYQDLTLITQDVTSGRAAFEQMAKAIANAHYEVDLTTLSWFPSVQPRYAAKEQAGNIILRLFRISQDVTVRNQVFLKKPGFCPRFPGIW